MSTRVAGLIIVEMAGNAPDRGAVLDDIRVLTAAHAPLLAQVERTLADGYACALQIEAEGRRLRQRLESQNIALLHLRDLLAKLRTEYAEATAPAGAPRRRSSRR